MNDESNEIWFERWLWSYMPCHWKGWAVLFLHIVPVGLAIGLLNFIANILERPWIGNLVIVPFGIAFASILRISKRRSRPVNR